ncbi:MAG: hypothetical protein ACLSAF_07865 [Intestinimonas sp.]
MGVLAVTPCEEKAHLRERLASIAGYRKGIAAAVLAAILALAVGAALPGGRRRDRSAGDRSAPGRRRRRPPPALLEDGTGYDLPNGMTLAVPGAVSEELLVFLAGEAELGRRRIWCGSTRRRAMRTARRTTAHPRAFSSASCGTTRWSTSKTTWP